MSRILFVDDENLPRQVARRVLQGRYDIELAENGEDAMQALSSGHYNLLITDIHMPGMNGLELIDQARGLYPELPCLVISGNLNEYDWEVALRDVPGLQKPFDMQEFLVAVEAALS